MSRIKITDNGMEVLMKMSDGNPGCLTFLMQLFDDDLSKAFMLCLRFDTMELYGSRLYQLWNDCCDRDLGTVYKVLDQYSNSDILRHIDNGKGYADRFDLK